MLTVPYLAVYFVALVALASPVNPLENTRYEMLERSTASSSAKSNRASRPLAPASSRQPRSRSGVNGDAGDSLSRTASPAASADLSLATAAKKPRRQARLQGLRGVLQGGEETDASPGVDGAGGAYLSSSDGAPQDSTENGPDGGGSSAATEEADGTTPAVRLFVAATSSPSGVPSPAIGMLGPPPPEAATAISGGRGGTAGPRSTEEGPVVDGAGLRNAARGRHDDDDDVDGEVRTAGVDEKEKEEKEEEEAETEVQRGGAAAAFTGGEVCPKKRGIGAAEEESETDTVKKWVACFVLFEWRAPDLSSLSGSLSLWFLFERPVVPVKPRNSVDLGECNLLFVATTIDFPGKGAVVHVYRRRLLASDKR